MHQKEAAALLQVDPTTILHWEKGYTEPPVCKVPAIVTFLGYDPYPEAKTLAEHLRAKRRAMGWSIRQAAEALGVDPATWGEWERGKAVRWPRFRKQIETLLDAPINRGSPSPIKE